MLDRRTTTLLQRGAGSWWHRSPSGFTETHSTIPWLVGVVACNRQPLGFLWLARDALRRSTLTGHSASLVAARIDCYNALTRLKRGY